MRVRIESQQKRGKWYELRNEKTSRARIFLSTYTQTYRGGPHLRIRMFYPSRDTISDGKRLDLRYSFGLGLARRTGRDWTVFLVGRKRNLEN